MADAVGTFTDYQSFVALLRARKEVLGLSDLALDELAGLTSGHVGKLLGPSQVRGIGPLTFGILLDALGLSGTLYVDPAKVASLGKIEQRKASHVRSEHRVGKTAIRRVMRELGRKSMSMLTDGQRALLASKGERSCAAKLSPAKRKAIARKAARARWRKAREQITNEAT
jgi:hypothetical protein